jgi:Flp pilus assembly protein CpaB
MFNVRSIVVTLLALICGGIAVMGAQGMVGANNRGAGGVKTVRVLVPKQAIERGSVLAENLLEWAEWPESVATKHMLTDLKAASMRRCREDLVAGEPVLEGNLVPRGEPLTAADMIGEGMRAMCIQFQTPAAAMAGLIFPKDRVDLYINEPARDGRSNPTSRLLLANVEVFAIGDQLSARKEKDKEKSKELQSTSVTFHVSVKDAAILDNARADGQLSIGLRNPKDKQVVVEVVELPEPTSDSVQPASLVAPSEPPSRREVVKPAAVKPMLFLRGNDSQLISRSWAPGR